MDERPDSWAWLTFTTRLEAGLNNGDLPMPERKDPSECDDAQEQEG